MQIIGPYLQVKINFLLVHFEPIETVFGVDLLTCALYENGSVVEINLQCLQQVQLNLYDHLLCGNLFCTVDYDIIISISVDGH